MCCALLFTSVYNHVQVWSLCQLPFMTDMTHLHNFVFISIAIALKMYYICPRPDF
jgi:hypothetical protein